MPFCLNGKRYMNALYTKVVELKNAYLSILTTKYVSMVNRYTFK